MKTAELIQKRKSLLKEYSHEYKDYRGEDTTPLNDVVIFFNLPEEKQEALVNYCLTAFIPMKKINQSCTSYGLKHVFETYPGGFHVSNGHFKAAMLIAGFLPENAQMTNWNFAILKKSRGINPGTEIEYIDKYYLPLEAK